MSRHHVLCFSNDAPYFIRAIIWKFYSNSFFQVGIEHITTILEQFYATRASVVYWVNNYIILNPTWRTALHLTINPTVVGSNSIRGGGLKVTFPHSGPHKMRRWVPPLKTQRLKNCADCGEHRVLVE